MDNNTLVVLIILLLTLNLLFVGFYIVLVLKEVRTAFIKINKILDTADKVTTEVSKPVLGFSGVFSGVVQGLKVLNNLKRRRSEEEVEDE